MTQTPREAAEAVRNEAVRLCGVFGLGLDRMKVRSLVVALKAIPLPTAPSEPTDEGPDADGSARRFAARVMDQRSELDTLRADLARMKAAMEEAQEALFGAERMLKSYGAWTTHREVVLALAAIAALKGTSP